MKNSTVYISNLSYERDRSGLISLFSPFGKIKSIKIIIEPTSQQPRGMAFVEMSNPAEAQRAIEGLNQKNVDGRTLKAKYATTQVVSTGKPQKDLEFKSVQLMKKARNEARKKRNPFS